MCEIFVINRILFVKRMTTIANGFQYKTLRCTILCWRFNKSRIIPSFSFIINIFCVCVILFLMIINCLFSIDEWTSRIEHHTERRDNDWYWVSLKDFNRLYRNLELMRKLASSKRMIDWNAQQVFGRHTTENNRKKPWLTMINNIFMYSIQRVKLLLNNESKLSFGMFEIHFNQWISLRQNGTYSFAHLRFVYIIGGCNWLVDYNWNRLEIARYWCSMCHRMLS